MTKTERAFAPFANRFEIVVWAFAEGTEDPTDWTVLDNNKDTLIVDDYEILRAAIDSGEIAAIRDKGKQDAA